MRTDKEIEDAAMEYIAEVKDLYSRPHQSIIDYPDSALSDIFIAGVQWAQRWIPVEEELPELHESVLVRYKRDGKVRYSVSYLCSYDVKGKILWLTNQIITHWRLIEIKTNK